MIKVIKPISLDIVSGGFGGGLMRKAIDAYNNFQKSLDEQMFPLNDQMVINLAITFFLGI